MMCEWGEHGLGQGSNSFRVDSLEQFHAVHDRLHHNHDRKVKSCDYSVKNCDYLVKSCHHLVLLS